MSARRWRRPDQDDNPPADRYDNPPADPDDVARSILLHRLEIAPRTRYELAATLRERNVPAEVAARVLDRFEEVGLINDWSFAVLWVESRQRARHLSRSALDSELRRKGVAPELIAEALADVSIADETAAAREVAEKKARAVAGLPRQVQYRRVAGALARKGYGGALSAQVVREVLDGHAEDELDADLGVPT